MMFINHRKYIDQVLHTDEFIFFQNDLMQREFQFTKFKIIVNIMRKWIMCCCISN